MPPQPLRGRFYFLQKRVHPTKRVRFGAIGVGGRGTSIANAARRFADVVGVCDLDTQRIDRVIKGFRAQDTAKGYKEYRKLLDRKDIDFVTIGTTDHWHTRVAIHAMQAGKDVYCEKPLTLTIDEGKQNLQGRQGNRKGLSSWYSATFRNGPKVFASYRNYSRRSNR